MRTYTALMTVAAVGAAAMTPVQGWWDNGHMLVGEVASELMSNADRRTIERVLTDWERSFPNTNTIATAAIWPDLIKCSKATTTCTTKTLPSIGVMSDWHYVNLPLNANGTQWGSGEPDVELFKSSFGGHAEDVLESFTTTFKTTQSLWAANLAIRQLIHILGDIHQPMHVVTAISEELPGGDQGGNKYVFPDGCEFSNLHMLYDAAGGAYTNNWALKMSKELKSDLAANASALIGTLSDIEDKVDIGQYMDLDYSAFAEAVSKNSVFEKFMLESYELSTDFAYAKLDKTFTDGKVPCPSAEYMAEATIKSKERIALAGKRLAVVLTKIAEQLRAAKVSK